MSGKLPFQLHVKSSVGFPIIGEDFIQYPANRVIKLEVGSVVDIVFGLTISSCDPRGKIVIELVGDYNDKIKISKNEFNPYYKNNLSARLQNISDKFIRIDTNEKIFKFHWILNKVSILVEPTKESATEPTKETFTDPSTLSVPIPVAPKPVTPKPVVPKPKPTPKPVVTKSIPSVVEYFEEPKPIAPVVPKPVAPVVPKVAEPKPVAPVVPKVAESKPVAPVVSKVAEQKPVAPVVPKVAEPKPVVEHFEEPAEPVISTIISIPNRKLAKRIRKRVNI